MSDVQPWRGKTAGHPPPGHTIQRSAPGAAASRYNEMGAAGVLIRKEADGYCMDNNSRVRAALACE